MKIILVCTSLVILLAASACGTAGTPSGSIEISDAWVRAASMMGAPGPATQPSGGMHSGGINSAAYLIIENKGSEPERLLRVEGDAAEAIELHKTEVQNEIMTMRPVEFIEIPPGGQVVLEPGGLHIMLINLKAPLKVGEQVKLTLVFENSDPIAIDAEVREP